VLINSSLVQFHRILSILQLFRSAKTCLNTQSRQHLVKIGRWPTLRDDSPLALRGLRPRLNVRHQPFQRLGAYYLLQILEQLSFLGETSHQVRLQLLLHHRKSRPSMKLDPFLNNPIPTFIRRFRAGKRTDSYSFNDPFFSLQVVPLVMGPAPLRPIPFIVSFWYVS